MNASSISMSNLTADAATRDRCEWCGQYAREDASGRCRCCGAMLPEQRTPAQLVSGIGMAYGLYNTCMSINLNSTCISANTAQRVVVIQ